jgi:hypothetical protein
VCWFLDTWTIASALLRMTQWAALRYDNTTTDVCGYAIRERTYQGLDSCGWIPKTEYWVLIEPFTYKDSSCTQRINIDGSNNQEVGFPDTMAIGCANPKTCVFETDQSFSVAPAKWQPLTPVPGVECIGLTDTQCLARATGGGAHSGWHTRVTATTVTVTNKP